MKFLLAAINAKYIHSNPAVYSLRAFAKRQIPEAQIEIGEYTINHQMEDILQDIYGKKPDFVGFSCYIWNIRYVLEIVRDLHKVLPEPEIWLGGPEVSYDAVELLGREPEIRGIMRGEGERTFLRLVEVYLEEAADRMNEACMAEGADCLSEFGTTKAAAVPRKRKVYGPDVSNILGISYRTSSGEILEAPPQPLLSMDELPFYYEDLSGFENRIIYYESSRGCPFSCSYCLSSIDKSVRFRSLDQVKRELDFFLEKKVPQVKFVDRTFNCRREHTIGIWRHITEHDNGITNFHFEISADLLDEEELELISRMRPGLIQLEIGVQSTNPGTVLEIHRKMDLMHLEKNVEQIHHFENTHQHLDLIAGLPGEDYQSFLKSFDDVYRMKPDQLQLGFLKVLKGSYMASQTETYNLRFRSTPPYEVLSTKWLDYGDVIRLKQMEEMVEVHYNSGQFPETMAKLERDFFRPSEIFLKLADYYERKKLTGMNHSRTARYEILYGFIRDMVSVSPEELSEYRDRLIFDLYLRENVKSRPFFAADQSPFKRQVKEFFIAEEKCPAWLVGYEGYDSRQLSKMAHLEAMEDGTFVLFDYKNRNPLSWNARAVRFSYENSADGLPSNTKGVIHGEKRNQKGQTGAGHGNPEPSGQGVWHRIHLLSES